eukprot:11180817-Alexandrium_andersonii.AAC.1
MTGLRFLGCRCALEALGSCPSTGGGAASSAAGPDFAAGRLRGLACSAAGGAGAGSVDELAATGGSWLCSVYASTTSSSPANMRCATAGR